MVADALHWILQHRFGRTSNLFHYLDDFFFAGPANTQECHQTLADMLTLCQAVQAPLKPEQMLGPASLLSILGIELDTFKMRARLPPDKLTALMEDLNNFSLLHSSTHICTKRQLLSLIGKLAFACKVIPASRIFLQG